MVRSIPIIGYMEPGNALADMVTRGARWHASGKPDTPVAIVLNNDGRQIAIVADASRRGDPALLNGPGFLQLESGRMTIGVPEVHGRGLFNVRRVFERDFRLERVRLVSALPITHILTK